MAVEGCDFAGGADENEGFEIVGRRLIERRIRRRGPDHRERPERLEIVGASQTLRLKRIHARASVAASRTAATISTCDPHRHRLNRSASRISASVG